MYQLVNCILHYFRMWIEVILVKRVKVVFVPIIPQQVQIVRIIPIHNMTKVIWGLFLSSWFDSFFCLKMKIKKRFFLELYYTSVVIFTIPILIRICFLMSGRCCIISCFIIYAFSSLFIAQLSIHNLVHLSSLFRQGSDEESSQQPQRRVINKRRVCSKELFSFPKKLLEYLDPIYWSIRRYSTTFAFNTRGCKWNSQ